MCVSVMWRYPVKTAGLIEMPFGMWAQLSPSNHVLDEGLDPSRGRGYFGVGNGLSHICNRMYTQWRTVLCVCP